MWVLYIMLLVATDLGAEQKVSRPGIAFLSEKACEDFFAAGQQSIFPDKLAKLYEVTPERIAIIDHVCTKQETV